jgi:N-acetylneuraminate synthase
MEKVKFIADISSNHCGDLKLAKDLIYAAKEAGADYAKFQYWDTEKFISKERFEHLKLGHQKNWSSVFDLYKKYQIPDWWIPELYEECQKVGIEFLLSCYDIEKVDEFDKYVKAWKIGSGDIDYIPMLEKVASKNKTIFLGCGASNKNEIYKARGIIELTGNGSLILFKCNTNYSSNDDDNIKYLNLNILRYGLYEYGYSIEYSGLSDHTKSDIPIILSIGYGIEYIERHFKLCDNDSPDDLFSLNPEEWKHMVKISEQTKQALGNGECKIQDNEKETRIIQRRSKKDWKRPDIEYYNEVGI